MPAWMDMSCWFVIGLMVGIIGTREGMQPRG